MRGCLGRDRTQTFPIELRPLKYQENFAPNASFPGPETFRPSCNRSGSLETTRDKRIGAVFRTLDGTRGSLLSSRKRTLFQETAEVCLGRRLHRVFN